MCLLAPKTPRNQTIRRAQPTLIPPSAMRRTALRKTSISSKVLENANDGRKAG
jgi:hypothetical protein